MDLQPLHRQSEGEVLLAASKELCVVVCLQHLDDLVALVVGVKGTGLLDAVVGDEGDVLILSRLCSSSETLPFCKQQMHFGCAW